MSEIVIRVRGEHEREVPAERGTVRLVVAAQGPEPGPVRAQVERDCATVLTDVRAGHDPDHGPVRRIVVDQVRTSVQQPTHRGRPRPPVHHASVSVSVEFDDVARLGGWLSALHDVASAAIRGITWDLADEHRRETTRDARRQALREALERAQDYADALDLGPVRPRSVADIDAGPPAPLAARAFAAPAAATAPDDGLGALLEPGEVTIRAAVDAEFVVPG
ncbi:SIMPL domain-containing protein [Pseudonocardia sp. HH130630-07]|uniref:SIMPL domain-containing protein n=1 Tax=Pseudonocardia sp. HH130630-07 TaxID=1690815 RepID=UPI00081530FA|nr:SIMPL domain-containing protein [Pseudonocardia sp. HH130630-07]ANY07018.1 hypothetical protein AFB00_12765 [Pseudonocardia sp. HH130630-07]